MGWGLEFDNRLEYAVGTFNGQRNLPAFNSRQDVMAFLNFKPFYNREEGFLLRDLHFGGSGDAGNENQPPCRPCWTTCASGTLECGYQYGAANSASSPSWRLIPE